MSRRDSLALDVRDAKRPAESLAISILGSISRHDPIESVCALSIAASHLVVMIGSEGAVTDELLRRIQPGTQAKLLECVTELCREARNQAAT